MMITTCSVYMFSIYEIIDQTIHTSEFLEVSELLKEQAHQRNRTSNKIRASRVAQTHVLQPLGEPGRGTGQVAWDQRTNHPATLWYCQNSY